LLFGVYKLFDVLKELLKFFWISDMAEFIWDSEHTQKSERISDMFINHIRL